MSVNNSVVIIDTACANLNSVRFALERLGVTPLVTAEAEQIQAADKVILPGVGTAQAAMRNLQQLQLVEVIRNLQQPVLGICLGMQLLTAWSAEGNVDCLNVIPARTERLLGNGLPLPHMGWNTLKNVGDGAFDSFNDGDYAYFVHSYAVATDAYTIASSHYGQTFAAMIRHHNFYGAQFHPERSGAVGARILKRFLELTDADTRA
ncbi:imidazole glycerol phosphate synthase subunit HisH [Pseudidiomarina mangrovi]|uniref:imidazole glycerol phosphate synthase subunit HisH n=1 Tax=Pseudidiomarina mangrovi TaxID=2487133 RepID=UPI000FCAC00A|nr:imidazole glycerol phosphate synthase subunit HisH [Pseudidiomarina mangrovi]CAI8152335.1 MAG: Imidazole glycerol phosphate synthase subunit HisH [Pseudidiomarina mangrovi]